MQQSIKALICIGCIGAVAATLHAQTDRAPNGRPGGWVTDRALVPAFPTPTAERIDVVSGIVHRPDLRLRNGTIEFDLARPVGAFAGVAFRMASTANYEILYFRRSDDGTRWGEMQYQPVFQGETNWQLYHEPGYIGPVPKYDGERDLHVRLVLDEDRVDVFVNRSHSPVLRIPQTKRPPAEGEIGFWASPADTDFAAAFKNLRVDANAKASLERIPLATHPPTQLTTWRLSPRFANDSIDPPFELPDVLRRPETKWIDAEAEPSGLINLNRQLGNAAGPQQMNVFGGAGWGVAYARLRIRSDRKQARRLWLAYSDAIGVYVNGRRIYTGVNASDSRYAGQLGIVEREADGVDLYLEPGVTEIVLAVTDKAFGWGFRARLDSLTGISIVE